MFCLVCVIQSIPASRHISRYTPDENSDINYARLENFVKMCFHTNIFLLVGNGDIMAAVIRVLTISRKSRSFNISLPSLHTYKVDNPQQIFQVGYTT